MLPQVIYSNVCQLCRVQRAAPHFRAGSRVGTFAIEPKDAGRHRLKNFLTDLVLVRRMPRDCRIVPVKAVGVCHNDFSPADFLLRAAVNHDLPEQVFLLQRISQRTGRRRNTGTQQVMPAAMPVVSLGI